MDNNNQQQGQQRNVQIKANDDALRGKYATHMQVSHSKEEFIFDFMSLFPPQANLVSRVVVSPQHAKRIAAALADNIKKYEDQFGTLKAGEDNKEIGFKVS